MTERKIVKDPEEFDLESLRLDPSHLEAASAKIPISIPAHKPSRHDWIRVHPSPSMAIPIGAIVLQDDRDEFYVVAPQMASQLGDDLVHFTLYPFINRLNVLRLWPVRLPNPDGRVNEWHRTAAIAAGVAQRKWIRVAANQNLGGYEIFEAKNQPPDPEWPDLTSDMVRIAFHDRGRIIKDVDHPVVKLLAGRL